MSSSKIYTYSSFSEYASIGIKESISEFNPIKEMPIIVCIGSDLVLGDSLGPLVGTILRQNGASAYVYGTLNAPITAKEVEYAKVYLKKIHPNSKVIAIDAGVGQSDDVGLIKVLNKGLKPGLGVDKNLSSIGDISVVGIVAAKSVSSVNLFNYTRLNLVYKMAKIISDGIINYLKTFKLSNTNIDAV